MRPSRVLIIGASVLFCLAVVVAFVPYLETACLVLAGGLAVCALFDALLVIIRPRLKFERSYQDRYALGVSTDVQATLTNRSWLRKRVRLYDGLPDDCEHEQYPYEGLLAPGEYAEISGSLTFKKRGELTITAAYIEVMSPLSLWWRSGRLGEEVRVKVYPNYVPALNYGLLATSDRVQQMGIIKKKSRGLSKEFHQLRDYQDGDQLNTIDWKATSRMGRMISREFQEERDQNVLLVTDCSFRTRAVDGDLPLLDHLLNAKILISYMAIKQGDKVGMMNFGVPAGQHRILPAVSGQSGMSKVLNHVYDYQSSKSYGEYETLAKRILSQPRKRSLVVILTNLRSEDQHGIVEALRLLGQKHLVLLASVRETAVAEILEQPVTTPAQANKYIGATAYEQDAEQIVETLTQQGIAVVRSPIESFAVDLANRYLDLRSEIGG